MSLHLSSTRVTEVISLTIHPCSISTYPVLRVAGRRGPDRLGVKGGAEAERHFGQSRQFVVGPHFGEAKVRVFVLWQEAWSEVSSNIDIQIYIQTLVDLPIF